MFELEEQLKESLSKTFGIPISEAHQLLSSLDNALRRWTHFDDPILVENALEALVVPNEIVTINNSPPPPPSPFFPSRREDILKLREYLTSSDPYRIIFLEGSPGIGKTSVVSKLCAEPRQGFLAGLVGFDTLPFDHSIPILRLFPKTQTSS